MRKGWKVYKMDQSGIAKEKRFTFFDQVTPNLPQTRVSVNAARTLNTVGKITPRYRCAKRTYEQPVRHYRSDRA